MIKNLISEKKLYLIQHPITKVTQKRINGLLINISPLSKPILIEDATKYPSCLFPNYSILIIFLKSLILPNPNYAQRSH